MDRVVKAADGTRWRLSHVGTEGPAVQLDTEVSRAMDVYEATRLDAPGSPPKRLVVPRAWDLDDPYVQEHFLTIELLDGFQ